MLNILTGPPECRANDRATVSRFMNQPGKKIVCGGTTSEIVARHTRSELRIDQKQTSLIEPPRCRISGVDLVTEGAVTLNQVYNLLNEDVNRLEADSAVAEFCTCLHEADRINILLGKAMNRANDDITFRQRGVLNREVLLPLLVDKLLAMGKLVTVERV